MPQTGLGEFKQTILVTGGAGYVGSHTTLLLLQNNYTVVVIDNCSNAYLNEELQLDGNGNFCDKLPESLRRVEKLAGKSLKAFYRIDLVQDCDKLGEIFRKFPIDAVIHFAALKSVNESISMPLEYYSNNLIGTINLLNSMKRNSCHRMIFSSSATVYGFPQYNPVDESHQVGSNILNPYGRTKYVIEEILKDLCKSNSNNNNKWNVISLRYFNPVGAHPSGYIGEHTEGVPNNLMPYISQVSIGKREKLFIFGNDFETIDGTGVRDFIHIMDLAGGHLKALDYLFKSEENLVEIGERGCNVLENFGFRAYNLGTGKGYSVLETIRTFEQVNKVSIPFEVVARREGDAGEVYADASLARRELNWSAQYSLAEMVRDTYKWQVTHPDGFKTVSNESNLNGHVREPQPDDSLASEAFNLACWKQVVSNNVQHIR